MAKRQPKTSQPLPLEPGEHILWEEQPEPSAYVKQRYGKLTAIGVILLVIIFGVQDIFNQTARPILALVWKSLLRC